MVWSSISRAMAPEATSTRNSGLCPSTSPLKTIDFESALQRKSSIQLLKPVEMIRDVPFERSKSASWKRSDSYRGVFCVR